MKNNNRKIIILEGGRYDNQNNQNKHFFNDNYPIILNTKLKNK